MKKIIGITSIFLGIDLIVSLIVAFCTQVSVSVPATSVFIYKLCTGIEYFVRYLPAILITGYVVGCSVYYGQNSEGSSTRFSAAMGKRLKSVMILSIAISAVLTINNEVIVMATGNKKKMVVNQPKLINDYVKVGNELLESGYYKRAQIYADAALKLSPTSKSAAKLADDAEVAINRQNIENVRSQLAKVASEDMESVEKVNINPQQIAETYKYYQFAKEAYADEQWFNAHYYAEIALGLASSKDPNLEELRKLANDSWNNVSNIYNLHKSENQEVFDKKYEGYLALVEKDDLKAYYIFRSLYQSSRELQKDPDIVFYLEVAENRVSNRYFFIDETLELKTFESANDVYFSNNYKDGTKDIVYFKGVTVVKSTGKTIQYLRDLTIESITRSGEHYCKMTVPYAKVLPVDVSTLHETTKELIGIDGKTKFVPYIMLKSVGRDSPELINEPEYVFASGEITNIPEYLVLPIPYDDFTMLESATADPNAMSMIALLKLITKASSYGYSDEVFGQVLFNRLFYPLWIIILFVFLASFGWNNRMNINQYFRTSWIIAFPGFIIISFSAFKLMMFAFKLMNYVLLSALGLIAGFWSGLIFYILFLLAGILFFMTRTTKG